MNDECYRCKFIKGCDRAKNLNTENCRKYFNFKFGKFMRKKL